VLKDELMYQRSRILEREDGKENVYKLETHPTREERFLHQRHQTPIDNPITRSVMVFFSKAVLLGLAAIAVAHPGHEEHSSSALKRSFLHHSRRSLAACAEKIEFRALQARAASRRRDIARKHAKRSTDSGES
jgi:predicted nuclease with RNAse H fold